MYEYIKDFNWPRSWETPEYDLLFRTGTTFSTIINIPHGTYPGLIVSARSHLRDHKDNLIETLNVVVENELNSQNIIITCHKDKTKNWPVLYNKPKILIYDFEFDLSTGDTVGTATASSVIAGAVHFEGYFL